MAPDARMRNEPAERGPIRVHDIIIRGNTSIKDTVIESKVEELLRGATTFQELQHATGLAEERLRGLDFFESVNVRVDVGPPELPGTANVVVEVSEPSNPFAGKLRSFAKSGGDISDATVGYGLGVLLPRFEAFRFPFCGQISLFSLDWLNFYSYKERALSLAFGNNDLLYNLTWTSLPRPYQPRFRLLSELRYSFKIDQRDSPLRPTKGFVFLASTHIGCRCPRPHSMCSIRQEFSLCYAIPLGFYGAALNLGALAGVESFRWGEGPAEPRRVVRDNMNNDMYFDADGVVCGGRGKGFSLGASAGLSFDLPLKVLRDAGIYGHVLAGTGFSFGGFSLQSLMNTLHDVRVGVIIPTRLFRLGVDYCYMIAGHGGYHQGKSGIAFSFL